MLPTKEWRKWPSGRRKRRLDLTFPARSRSATKSRGGRPSRWRLHCESPVLRQGRGHRAAFRLVGSPGTRAENLRLAAGFARQLSRSRKFLHTRARTRWPTGAIPPPGLVACEVALSCAGVIKWRGWRCAGAGLRRRVGSPGTREDRTRTCASWGDAGRDSPIPSGRSCHPKRRTLSASRVGTCIRKRHSAWGTKYRRPPMALGALGHEHAKNVGAAWTGSSRGEPPASVRAPIIRSAPRGETPESTVRVTTTCFQVR